MKVRFYNSEYSFELLNEDTVNLIEGIFLISDLTGDTALYGLLECLAQGRFYCLFQEINFTHVQISKC